MINADKGRMQEWCLTVAVIRSKTETERRKKKKEKEERIEKKES